MSMLDLVTHSILSYRSCESHLGSPAAFLQRMEGCGHSVWEKIGWAGARNGKVPNMVDAPGLSVKNRVCREGSGFQDSKPAISEESPGIHETIFKGDGVDGSQMCLEWI